MRTRTPGQRRSGRVCGDRSRRRVLASSSEMHKGSDTFARARCGVSVGLYARTTAWLRSLSVFGPYERMRSSAAYPAVREAGAWGGGDGTARAVPVDRRCRGEGPRPQRRAAHVRESGAGHRRRARAGRRPGRAIRRCRPSGSCRCRPRRWHRRDRSSTPPSRRSVVGSATRHQLSGLQPPASKPSCAASASRSAHGLSRQRTSSTNAISSGSIRSASTSIAKCPAGSGMKRAFVRAA